MRDRTLNFGKQFILWLSIFFIGFLSVISFISTTYFSGETSFAERPQYRMDNLLINGLFILVGLLFFYWLNKGSKLDRFPMKGLVATAIIFVVGISYIWITISHTYPEADQKAVSWVAWLMSQNNFLFFEHGKYMQIYPNQLGLAAILEGLYRLAGEENWKLFMYVTALSNGAVVYLLYRITDRLFHNKRISCLVLFLSMGCIQIMLYTTFLYGIMLGLALSLASFLFLLYFLQEEKSKGKKLIFLLLSAFFIGTAILVKNNYSIFLVAMILLVLYKTLEQKKLQLLLAALAILVVAGLMGKELTSFYERRANITISSGMPKSLWIAMGMQEGERAEGWYNAFNYDTFLNTDCDISKSDAIAKSSIQHSLNKFVKNPGYAFTFYYKKIVSQWNEPTYESLWVNQFHSGEFSRLVQSIYDGKLYKVLHEYMNGYQGLILVATFISLFYFRKALCIEQLFLMLVILGGFGFHVLWEAKSQYIFPYFVILLPYGAVGIWECVEWMEKIRRRGNEK